MIYVAVRICRRSRTAGGSMILTLRGRMRGAPPRGRLIDRADDRAPDLETNSTSKAVLFGKGRPLSSLVSVSDKSNQRAARSVVAGYHEAELAELVVHVGEAVDRYRAGELDAFDVDRTNSCLIRSSPIAMSVREAYLRIRMSPRAMDVHHQQVHVLHDTPDLQQKSDVFGAKRLVPDPLASLA
jgi:hypothetical protein